MELISMDDDVLFHTYRTDRSLISIDRDILGRENLPPMEEEEPVGPSLMEIEAPPPTPPPVKVEDVSSSLVATAAAYEKELALLEEVLREADNQKCRLRYAEIMDTMKIKFTGACKLLFEARIEQTNVHFARRFMLEMLSVDKRATKIVGLLNDWQALFLDAAHGLADHQHVTSLVSMIRDCYCDSLAVQKDEFLMRCLRTKKRGRTSDDARKNMPNCVNKLKKKNIPSLKTEVREWDVYPSLQWELLETTDDITSDNPTATGDKKRRKKQQQAATVVVKPEPIERGVISSISQEDLETLPHQYRVFLQTLMLMFDEHDWQHNYGSYMQRLRDVIYAPEETLPEWPLRGLFKSVLNMEACLVDAVEGIDCHGQFYQCCYSGEKIRDGDQVYRIRILEYDAKRFDDFTIKKVHPNREFDTAMVLDHLHTFLMKKECVGLAGVFPRDFDAVYKQKYKLGVAELVVTTTTPKSLQMKGKKRPVKPIKPVDLRFQSLETLCDAAVSADTQKEYYGRVLHYKREQTRIFQLLDQAREESLFLQLYHVTEPYSAFPLESESNTAFVSALLEQVIDLFALILHGQKVHASVLLSYLEEMVETRATTTTHKNVFATCLDMTQSPVFQENSFLYLSLFAYVFRYRTVM